MKVAGIIAEYDLFHNGHAAQIEMLKTEYGVDCVVVCLSSALVQRGSPALLPDSVRAAAALGGPRQARADLVIALPAPYASATAQQFAAAGVHLLAGIGCDLLAFGAETPDTAAIRRAAQLLESEECDQLIREFLEQKDGSGYAVCRQRALATLAPELEHLLENPNDNLGVEYCAAILRLNKQLQPQALPRLGALHSDRVITGSICSGTALRAAWAQQGPAAAQGVTPPHAAQLYRQAWEQGLDIDPLRLDVALLSRLRARAGEGPKGFADLRGLSEGIEHRLCEAVQKAATMEQVYDAVTTRRYPRARVRRLCLDAALGYGLGARETDLRVPPLPPYARILGATPVGVSVLGRTKLPTDASLARLTHITADCARAARTECAAADLAALCRRTPGAMGTAFTEKPIFTKE